MGLFAFIIVFSILVLLAATCPDDFNKLALINAAKSGDFDLVKCLVEKGADLDVQDPTAGPVAAPDGLAGALKRTALEWSVIMDKKEGSTFSKISLYLIDKGAKLNLRDRDGRATIFWAVMGENKMPTLKALVKAGADIDIVSNYRQTALIRSTENNFYDMCEVLVKAGANLDVQDYERKTALHWAASHGNDDIVQLYIENGAKLNLKDKNDKTALDYATENGHGSTAHILTKAGAEGSKARGESLRKNK